MEHRHILICGERGVGKSTLIKKLTAELDVAAGGFVTEKRQIENTCTHGVYINPAAGERRYTKDNMAGFCHDGTWDTYTEVFDEIGAGLICADYDIIIMDELGFMESKAEKFTKAVLSKLDGDVPVIAAVKARYDIPFLEQVRNHEKCLCFTITPENRDELFEEIKHIVRSWGMYTV